MSDSDPEGPSLLVVEDDSELSTSLLLYLESEGYEVTLAETGETALQEATRLPGYDLIVLDAKLPDLSGFEVLRQSRDDGVRTPVLMLTGLGDHEHKMRGFQVGADDYLTKPFETEELVARIDVLLRREAEATDETGTFRVGGLRVDLEEDDVSRDGEPVDLTDLEYKLLAYLLRRRGRTATREQILRDVWDLPTEVETRTIDRHVNALRDVMDGEAEDEWPIQSVYGIGYKLEGAERTTGSEQETV
ncbi:MULTISPECIES: response regulator transcription factor [Salinibacter]|jgi:Response regulators consisting of a CheY-like receiver domain and a winged-helix DNA-binding domain|uniref:response regulator transcription factor n=1 Tax=Salinibacter TaxID=146918 RepID=UPI001ABB3F62|nr:MULTISPECIES: response regulator transcription factor [Salinibacter]